MLPLDCQQISGSGNLPLYVVKRVDFEITGRVNEHRCKSDSGNDQILSFAVIAVHQFATSILGYQTRFLSSPAHWMIRQFSQLRPKSTRHHASLG